MPKRTIRLIDELVKLGITDHTFVRLHHLGTLIKEHRRYCDENVSEFRGPTNPAVRNRLEFIYSEIQGRRFSAPLPDGLLDALADEALERYPMEGVGSMGSALRTSFQVTPVSPSPAGEGSHAGRLDRETIQAYMEDFFGYGNLSGDYWFIGMEEGGGTSFQEVERRLAYWNERGRRLLEDLAQYHEAIGEHRWFLWRKVQPTWVRLIRILLSAKGLPHDDKDVLSYQVDRLGREAGETCLMELMPLPSQSTGHWQYGSWSDLQTLRSREVYLGAFAMPRVGRIEQLVAQHHPRVVVFYGLTYRRIWAAACPRGVAFKSDQIAGLEVSVAHQSDSTYVLCAHPASRGASNRYFDAVGRRIRELSARS